MYKVSIIIPIYNVENYIFNCLNSVIIQKRNNIDIECLLIDDCSSDNSYEIANTFVNNHKGAVRFVLLHNELNKGLSAARNIGIQNATGDFVFFLDSDDYLLPDCLFQMTSVLKDNPDVDYIEGRFYSPKDNRVYPIRMGYQTIRNRIDLLKHFYAGRLSHVAWNKLIRRQIIISNSLFFAEGIIYEDIQWSNRLLHCISSAVVIPDVTYEYEYNPMSISNTSYVNATKSIDSLVNVLDSFLMNNDIECYVDHKLFIFHYLLIALDIQMNCVVDEETNMRFICIKKKLFFQTFFDGRIILSLFFLLMFKPFSFLFKNALFRHNIYRLEKSVSIPLLERKWIGFIICYNIFCTIE